VRTICLFSSNGQKEYILDVLETIALPRGAIQHFRYQLKYVDPKLVSEIPHKGGPVVGGLPESEVVVFYLYQKENVEREREWKSIYPVRRGKLVEWYKTGETEHDIAHFYFEVSDYFDYREDSKIDRETEKAKSLAVDHSLKRQSYVCSASQLDFPVFNPAEDESAFHGLVTSFKIEDFKPPLCDSPVQYYPVFCFIRSLRESEGVASDLSMSYDQPVRKSYYELKEQNRYVFELSYNIPWKTPGKGSEITLRCPAEHFVSLTLDRLMVGSRYDEESWPLVTRRIQTDLWSAIEVQTKIAAPNGSGWEPLNISRSFPVFIKRKLYRRKAAAFGDWLAGAFLALGTASITIFSITPSKVEFIAPTIIGFAGWAIIGLVVKVGRA
jgi:hypothetical protein